MPTFNPSQNNLTILQMSIPSDHFAKTPVISMEDTKIEKEKSGTNSPNIHSHMVSSVGNLESEETICLNESENLNPSLKVKKSQIMTSSLTNLNASIGQSDYENSSSLTMLEEQKNTISTQKSTDYLSKRSSHITRYRT